MLSDIYVFQTRLIAFFLPFVHILSYLRPSRWLVLFGFSFTKRYFSQLIMISERKWQSDEINHYHYLKEFIAKLKLTDKTTSVGAILPTVWRVGTLLSARITLSDILDLNSVNFDVNRIKQWFVFNQGSAAGKKLMSASRRRLFGVRVATLFLGRHSPPWKKSIEFLYEKRCHAASPNRRDATPPIHAAPPCLHYWWHFQPNFSFAVAKIMRRIYTAKKTFN